MDNFLFELGCEELPPKALPKLEKALLDGVRLGLQQAGLQFSDIKSFATPRRLAFIIKALESQQPDQQIEKLGPSEDAAYDASGNPSKAALGFARSCEVDFENVSMITTPKGKRLAYSFIQKGKRASELLPEIITKSLHQLPIPKPMRWGSKDIQFVRPVHWVVMLYGSDVVDAEILGKKSARMTYGHRFMHPGALSLKHADEYEETLKGKAYVIPDFIERRENIREQIITLADTMQAKALLEDDLLNEVTAIVEWPVALLASFDQEFLKVPAEALIASMRDHQKYFALMDKTNKLLANFITICNIDSKNSQRVINGNERVMRARLSDAAFFYHTDCKQPFNNLLPRLHDITFQSKLGSLFDKAQRLTMISKSMAQQVDLPSEMVEKAAWLCKCDLLTHMVMEFPELQGTMGKYYAQNSGEAAEVALAIEQHYLPRFAKDILPTKIEGTILAIAERLDNVVGIFGIGEIPTGDKDPFALRRAALGLVRIIIENKLTLNLQELLTFTCNSYQVSLENKDVIRQTHQFIIERMKGWVIDNHGITADVFSAVIARQDNDLLDIYNRLEAVKNFRLLDQASSLAAANKRVSNLLIKESNNNYSNSIKQNLLQIDAEIKLAQVLHSKQEMVAPLFAQGKYNEALKELADLREPVDSFFDNVMVMVEEDDLRNNRLALLNQLRTLFLKVADISLLQG